MCCLGVLISNARSSTVTLGHVHEAPMVRARPQADYDRSKKITLIAMTLKGIQPGRQGTDDSTLRAQPNQWRHLHECTYVNMRNLALPNACYCQSRIYRVSHSIRLAIIERFQWLKHIVCLESDVSWVFVDSNCLSLLLLWETHTFPHFSSNCLFWFFFFFHYLLNYLPWWNPPY